MLIMQTSLLRALSPTTPTVLFPAMNTHMFQHPLTADHLRVVQDKLGYMVSGPQGAGILACGDEGELSGSPFDVAELEACEAELEACEGTLTIRSRQDDRLA
jgi:hypothetical protein